MLKPATFLFLIFTFVWTSAAADHPRLVFMIGEDEYKTWETLPAFAAAELKPLGYETTIIHADKQDKDNFPGLVEALGKADLLVLSVRRRTPPREQLEAVQTFLRSGKPLVGIRTACHAFVLQPQDRAKRDKTANWAEWPEFDPEVLGGHYVGHSGAGPKATIRLAAGAEQHAILRGVDISHLEGNGSLYLVKPLAASADPLLIGEVPGREPEPVAWTRFYGPRHAPIFYTSLGHPDDFQNANFRRLFVNAIAWGLSAAQSKPTAGAQHFEPRVVATAPDVQSEAEAQPLSPAESLSRLQTGDDFQIDQLLTEPLVAQPVFLNFDERGRMWVVQYRQYPDPAGLKMISRDNVWRAVYDKVSPPPPHQFVGRDKITIHEDTNGDGIFDKSKTFVDGLNITTAVERGRGGVWVLNPPYLLFYPDANNDDIPDGDPVVHLAGFGLEDTHSVANSLRWGPDGWLYGAQGSTVTGHMVRPGLDTQPFLHTMGQLIWRYHPETRRFEVFAEGGGNAFGCEFDSKGRIFSGHNGGDTRGFHYVQGGYLQKGFEKHGPLSNPYAFGYFPPMRHHAVKRFTHNFIVYEGGALPEIYNGKLFGAEPLQGRVVLSDVVPDQSTFRTHDLGYPLVSADRWFRPVDIKAGPDGAIYVCDWYDQQVNHYRNHEGKIDPGSGRVYRLKGKGAPTIAPFDLTKLSSAQLVDALTNANKWFRQTALRLLADRRDASVIPLLTERLFHRAGQDALEALWALHLSGGFNERIAAAALHHANPYVRLWTVRLLGDDKKVSPNIENELVQLAQTETDLEVRNQLACSARRLPAPDDLRIAGKLAEHDEDAADNRMPLLIWWAIEAKADSDRDEVLRLFYSPAFWERPLVKQHLLDRTMRRYAQAGTRRDLLACARLFELAPKPEHSRILMTGFEQAFKGRPLAGLPNELLAAMSRHGAMSLALSVRRGDPAALQQAIERIADERTPLTERLELIAVFGEIKNNACVPPLLKVLETAPAFRKAALQSLEPYSDAAIGERVLALYPALSKQELPTAQMLLASRAGWSRQTVAAAAAGRIAAESFPAGIVRKLKQQLGPDELKEAERLWGKAGLPSNSQLESQIRHLASVVRTGVGNPYQGRALFANTCAVCHTLFGSGGQVGPDLTTYQRDDLETMLLAIANPSAEIREGFENFQVETTDGRSLNGFLVEQDSQVVVLRGMDGLNVSLERKDIAELRAAGTSLMPEGLMDSLKEQQIRDLFAYLRCTQPLIGDAP